MAYLRGTLADVIGDNLVYRNLEPVAAELAGLRAIWPQLGMDHYLVPRKTSAEYAAAVVEFVQQAQRVRGVGRPLARALFIGDTLMNDGTAARNIGQHLPMRCFIGADRLQQPRQVKLDGELMVANRWEALPEFVEWAAREGLACDEQTVVLIDLDKTFLGARGRNDKVIDAARVAAVLGTMQAALGESFDEAVFRAVYDPLNQPDYHFFTADNQDYLAYICLMVVAGIYPAEQLWADLAQGQVRDFAGFVARCEANRQHMSAKLVTIHTDVCRGLETEDPTPFKAFRRREYLETVGRMDLLPDEAPEDRVLASEIVITAEVVSVARHLQARGALLFGLSDKPDEASFPTDEAATAGRCALHRTRMKVYGATLY